MILQVDLRATAVTEREETGFGAPTKEALLKRRSLKRDPNVRVLPAFVLGWLAMLDRFNLG